MVSTGGVSAVHHLLVIGTDCGRNTDRQAVQGVLYVTSVCRYMKYIYFVLGPHDIVVATIIIIM